MENCVIMTLDKKTKTVFTGNQVIFLQIFGNREVRLHTSLYIILIIFGIQKHSLKSALDYVYLKFLLD